MEWLAAQYTGKHLHTLRSVPKLDSLRSDIGSFINKVKWRSVFDKQGGGADPVVKIKRPIQPCENLVEPEVSAWCRLFRQGLLRAAQNGVETGARFNTSKLYLWAVKRLRRSMWSLMKNDKEGSWSIMQRHEKLDLTRCVLAGGNYEPILGVDLEPIHSRCSSMAKRVAKVEDDERWLAAVAKGWRQSTMIARLRLLLKSHKPEGEVSCRAVHSLPAFSLEGLSRWVMRTCREALVGLDHLVPSSKTVVDRVSKIRVGSYLIMVKLDIKDFYVVGEPHMLAEAVAVLFSDPVVKSTMWDVLHFLLDNQYVKDLDKLYKVRHGCGIGLLHSGDVADAAFYSLVEKILLDNDEFIRYGVVDWYRFRDDMCFLLHSGPLFQKLLDRMRRLSGCFELKVEEVSTVELRYLDVVLRREDDRIVTYPYLKDPGLSRRLSCKSAHPREIHLAWPKMMLQRVPSLSNSDGGVAAYNAELLRRLYNDGCLVHLTHNKNMKSLKRVSRSSMLWLPMGYHPWWCRQMKRAVSRMNNDASLNSLLRMAVGSGNLPTVRVSWKNMLPSTDTLLQS